MVKLNDILITIWDKIKEIKKCISSFEVKISDEKSASEIVVGELQSSINNLETQIENINNILLGLEELLAEV